MPLTMNQMPQVVNLSWRLPLVGAEYLCTLFSSIQQTLISEGSGPGPVLGTGGLDMKQMWTPPSGNTKVKQVWSRSLPPAPSLGSEEAESRTC